MFLEVTSEGVSDGETLIAIGIWFHIWGSAFKVCFLSWEHAGAIG